MGYRRVENDELTRAAEKLFDSHIRDGKIPPAADWNVYRWGFIAGARALEVISGDCRKLDDDLAVANRHVSILREAIGSMVPTICRVAAKSASCEDDRAACLRVGERIDAAMSATRPYDLDEDDVDIIAG